jgi:alpha-D-xyloside xylohydrolase
MKQTNYHLFDFMDFDPSLEKDESLWKAYAPTKILERNGDIVVTIPYQKQRHQEDMAPDTSAPHLSFDLVIRAYEPNIVRLFTTMAGDEMTEADDMLQFSPEVKRLPLSCRPMSEGSVGCDIIAVNGKKVAHIDLSAPKLDHWSDLLPAPQPAPFITFYPDGDETKGIALSDDHFSPPRYDALPLGFCLVSCCGTATNQTERATISFKCAPDECFVGTGERFRKMDLSGQTFQLKNQDGQGVNNRRCYKNIPFYMSSRMYGCFYHTSDYCKLSLADHSTRSVQFLNDHATLDVFLIGGQTPEEILKGYRMLTGFPSMPPLWSFGIWMSRMTYFSADEVDDICDRLRREHYPCDVIHLDTGWFRTDWLCEWKFNPERFPDPKGFIKRLKDNGFRVSLWQLPYVAAGAEQLAEAKENHYISTPVVSGSAADNTGGASNFSALDYAGTIDFTYGKAVDWYKNQLLKPLLDMGVTCIKTDFGENIHMDHRYHSMMPERLNNIYSLLYQRAAYEVTKEVTGDGIVWARSAWTGCQRYPLHWGGDSASSWDGLAGSLKGGLHFGLSGFAFWSHDVPGFHSIPDFMNSPLDEDVYVRWTQFGVFSSHMRYHGTCKREPWHYPQITPIVKKWWKLRYQLLPYIVEQGEKCTKSGYPMMRALVFHHPHDRQCWHIDDEYYFGSEFLCCPVMNSDNKRDIYLPEGLWVNFFTGERLEGGRWYYGVEVSLDQMPVFVRPGSLIKMYPDDVDCTDQMDLSKAVTIEITKEFKGI